MNIKKSSEPRATNCNQAVIVRFRVSDALYMRLKSLAKDEEMSLGAFVRRVVIDALKKFPSPQD